MLEIFLIVAIGYIFYSWDDCFLDEKREPESTFNPNRTMFYKEF